MRTSKDKTETESFKLHSQDRCSGFKVSFGGRPNYELNWISPSVGPRGLNQSNGGAFTFEGSDPRLPLSLFPDLERKSNADNISLSNNTHPEALLRPFTLVLDLNTSIQVKSGVYHPLPGAYAFRLLEILPGEADMLECKLHVCNLKENATAYEALSYTWGAPDSSSERKITVISQGINRSMAISGSLHAALRELRRNDASRVVWADAICINQEDGKEKGQQVALMGQIFSGAWQVIVWLGEKSDRCMCGNTVLDTSLSSISKAFSGICSVVNEWLAHGGQETLEATYLEISKDGQSTVHHANTHDDGDRRSAMMQLFQRLWFSRIWVLQEIVLARHAVVQLGSYQIPWEWLGLAAATVVHNPDLLLSNVGRRMIPAGVTNSYLMYRLSVSQSYFSRLELTFTQLLQVSRQFESKEPKDKVYGLLGIETTDSVGKQIIPDYRETTASEKVFEDIARLMLQTTSPLKFLSGTGALRAYVPSGPSWVPSWHKRQPWTLLPIQQNSGFQCASGAPMELHPKQKAGELVLKGVIIDHISSMQEHRYSFGIFGENEKVRDNLLNEPMWSQETWRKCAMTLACGGDERAYPIDDEAAHLADLAALVLSRSPHWIIRDLIALRDVIEPEGDRMTQAEYLTQTVEGGNSRRYINAVEPIRKPYRLFKTASKDFGVGPVDMKIGDKLCVLFGAEVPFLLRPKGDGYLVIGECYVYDLMHGEILEKLAADPEGQLKAEWIKLI